MDLHWLQLFLLPIVAHVLYGIPPDPEGSGESHVTLHNGDDFSTKDEAPHPERLSSVRAVTAAGAQSLQAQGTKATGVRVDTTALKGQQGWVVVETPPTLIELAPAKFESYLEHEGLNHVLQFRSANGEAELPGRELYSKHTKTALSAGGGAVRFLSCGLGLPIEFVPNHDGPLGQGSKLEVVVLVDGVAAADLQVRVSYRESEAHEPSADILTRTDERGMVSVVLDRAGIWRLHTIYMQRHEGGEADWVSVWASLTFRF
jgi:hypothetical protein